MRRGLRRGQDVLDRATRADASIASIADELVVDDGQVKTISGASVGGREFRSFSTASFRFQLRSSLREQQEVNAQLGGYIDGILVGIIDKYPELLEVQN